MSARNMASLTAKLGRFFEAAHIKRTAAIMVLSLFTIAGVFMMAEAFNPHNSSANKNTTSTDPPRLVSSAGSSLVIFNPIASASASIKATLNRRVDEGLGDSNLNSVHSHAFDRPAGWMLSTTVTITIAAAIGSSTTSPRIATTFETVFTTEGEKLPPPTSTRSLLRTRYLSIASQMDSEAGIHSTAPKSGFRIATYNPLPSSGEPDLAATPEVAAASTSLANITPAISSSISQSLLVTYGGSISLPVTTFYDPISSTTVSTKSSKTSRIQDPARPSGESHSPHGDGHAWPTNYNPFATIGLVPSGSLTSPVIVLSSTPTQGVPSTPLSSIVATISSSAATTVAGVTSNSVSPSLTSPSTQLQSIQPTSSPTSAPLVVPSSDSKKRLTIGLSVCIPFLVGFAIFITWWLRTRYVEKKRADDLEKDIIWMTPRPRTPRTPTGSRTSRITTRKDHTGGTRIAGSTLSTPARPDPPGLNDVEREMAEDYHKGVAEVNAKRAARMRSGGPKIMRQGLDGANDTPPRRRPSQIFIHHKDGLLNPVSDANEIGLAISTPDENRIRNALEHFQPTRLSTITDKSGEVEMPEIPTPFGGSGSGPIEQGGNVKGRFFERFVMKRKGMMPLEG